MKSLTQIASLVLTGLLLLDLPPVEAQGRPGRTPARQGARAKQSPRPGVPRRQAPPANPLQQLMDRALRYQRAGQRNLAIETYKQLLRIVPGSYPANMNIAMLYEDIGDALMAASFYRKAHQVEPQNAQPLVQLSALYLRTGKLNDALMEAQRAVALDPKNAQAPYILGTVHAATQNWVAAEAAYRLSIRLAPAFGRAHLGLANALASQNKVGEAISVVEAAVKADSQNAEAYAYLGTLKYMTGELEGAIAAYKRAVQINPRSSADHFNLGIAYDKVAERTRDKKLIAKAIEAYQAALKELPGNVEARANLARGYYNLGDYARAAASFSQAAAIRPSASILSDTGLAYAQAANSTRDAGIKTALLKKAEVHYVKALALKDAPATAFNGLAYVYDLMGSLEKAAGVFTRMAARFPKASEPWTNLGKLREAQKKPDLAESAYKRAVQADPDSGEVKFALARFYERNGKSGEAIDVYKKLIAKNEEDPEPRRYLGQLYLKLGRRKDAITEFEFVRRLQPKDRGILIALGSTYEQSGDFEAALREFRQLILLNPDDVNARWYAGRALEQAKRYEEAILEYREAEKLSPNDNFHGLNIARLLVLLEKNEDAAVEYLRLVQKNPNDVSTRVQLGEFLEKRGKVSEAAEQYHAIVNSNPKATDSWLKLGGLYEKQGKKDEARDAYLRAVEDPAATNQAYARLQSLFEGETRPDAWISFLQARLTENPSNLMALARLEETSVKAGKQADLLAFLASLGTGKASSDRAFVSAWAVIVNKHGKAEDSVAAFKRVVALSPGDHRAWASLALLQDSLKRIPEAIAAYEEITRLKAVPKVDMVQYRMNLAHLYEKAGQSAKAVSQYREALRLEPQNTNALDNLKRLGG